MNPELAMVSYHLWTGDAFSSSRSNHWTPSAKAETALRCESTSSLGALHGSLSGRPSLLTLAITVGIGQEWKIRLNNGSYTGLRWILVHDRWNRNSWAGCARVLHTAAAGEFAQFDSVPWQRGHEDHEIALCQGSLLATIHGILSIPDTPRQCNVVWMDIIRNIISKQHPTQHAAYAVVLQLGCQVSAGGTVTFLLYNDIVWHSSNW